MNDTIFLHVTGEEIAASVTSREYQRLLSLPRDLVLEGDLLERANTAREWYMKNGNPFLAARKVNLKEVSSTAASLTNGLNLQSAVLAKRLRDGEAHALEILAASAGNEVAQEVTRLWSIEHPDEAFFLDRFAVAVAEQLVFWASATLCRLSESENETLMTRLSPGCGHWDIADQHKLMTMLTCTENQESGGTILGPLQLLSSGAIHPQHSLLAVMGVTHRKFVMAPELICRSCDLEPCGFRRAPFAGEALRPLETR
jgi:hypothetical protein